MPERALSFGSAAASYERYRLGYPGEVVDLVLGHAVGPVATALEIGAGTGKATRVFTARGIAVTATDPDGEMLAQLRAHVSGTVTIVQATLEALAAGQVAAPFDLVYAAAALHWTDPAQRWARIAALLRPGGVVASFGGPMMLADPQLRDRVAAVLAGVVEDDDIASPDGTSPTAPLQWPGTEMAASPLFTVVAQSAVRRRPVLAADDVVGELSTVSAYLMLPEDVRREVLGRIRAVLPDRVEVWADVIVHVARRR